MQISTIINQNLEKPSRNPSNRTKVNILKKKNCQIACQKNLAQSSRKCSNIKILAKIKGNESKKFRKLTNIRFISCLCTNNVSEGTGEGGCRVGFFYCSNTLWKGKNEAEQKFKARSSNNMQYKVPLEISRTCKFSQSKFTLFDLKPCISIHFYVDLYLFCIYCTVYVFIFYCILIPCAEASVSIADIAGLWDHHGCQAAFQHLNLQWALQSALSYIDKPAQRSLADQRRTGPPGYRGWTRFYSLYSLAGRSDFCRLTPLSGPSWLRFV